MKYTVHMDISGTPGTRQFRTLAEARAFIRRMNGGRLYGKYQTEDGDEGWNLGAQEGCDTAVISRQTR